MRPEVPVLLLATSLTCTAPLPQQTRGMVPPPRRYWWLGLPNPFGGRNYNFDEIQRGEHIPKPKQKSQGRNRRNGRKRRNKREVGEDDAELENEVALSDIETECPRRTRCVPSFFCDSFNGVTTADQIPCLLQTGEFAGKFGICCREAFPRQCPSVPPPPPPAPALCLPRPLGRPADHQCALPGSRAGCPNNSLCCFNGCLNVCLEDPPYSVQEAFFDREEPVVA